MGQDYYYFPDPILFVGESWVQSKVLILTNNNVWTTSKVLRLGLVVDPPSAKDPTRNEIEIWITDDGDGGVINIPQFSSVPEASVSDPNIEEWTNETCAIWAERTSANSGSSHLSVEYVHCAANQPAIREEAQDLKDFLYIPSARPMIWEDGDWDRKCVVGMLSQEIVQGLLNGNIIANWTAFTVWLNPDGKMERDEGICFTAKLLSGSSSSLHTSQFALMLQDSGIDGGGRLRCIRGVSCTLTLDNSSMLPDLIGFVQGSEECGVCRYILDYNLTTGQLEITSNNSDEHQVYFIASGDGEMVKAEIGMSLNLWFPGAYSVCQCLSEREVNGELISSRQVASMVLTGPQLRNNAFCVMSAEECAMDLHIIQTVEPIIGKDHLRVFTNCAHPELTNKGLRQGAKATLSKSGFRMDDPNEMRKADNGMYELCWCRETATQKCIEDTDFKVSAGLFVYVGPNRLPPRASLLGESLNVEGVYGTGLQPDDKAMLLLECGVPHPTGNLVVNFDANKSAFLFPALRQADGFLAKKYKLCWCLSTSRGYEGTLACDGPEDFRADFGEVTLICPKRSVDLQGDGHCSLCPLMIQEAGGAFGMECVVSMPLFSLASIWFLMMTLFFLLLCGSLRCSLRARSLNGMPRKIEDVSKMRGKLMITTAGYHNFRTYSKHPIPVTLWNTGHFLLDSKPNKVIQLNVIPVGEIGLEVVTEPGEAVDFTAESSMGAVQVSFFRSLIHSTFPKTKIPLIVQLLLLLAGSIVPRIFLHPTMVELVMLPLCAFATALFLLLIWKWTIRSHTTLKNRLQSYEQIQRTDEKRKTKVVERGPSRGIRVWKLLDLFEHFQALIRDRNMYYLDPNIIRPLTASVKLSFAEYVGPDTVQWFVSHWWGTPVAVYCDALKRHASEVRVKESESVPGFSSEKGKDKSWENTSYWICTFSNNQYKIGEELGEVHTQSSFYLALHSEGLKGTCMILDEMAMPLKRSWCLFELLQTIELEEKAQAETRPFAGAVAAGLVRVDILNHFESHV